MLFRQNHFRNCLISRSRIKVCCFLTTELLTYLLWIALLNYVYLLSIVLFNFMEILRKMLAIFIFWYHHVIILLPFLRPFSLWVDRLSPLVSILLILRSWFEGLITRVYLLFHMLTNFSAWWWSSSLWRDQFYILTLLRIFVLIHIISLAYQNFVCILWFFFSLVYFCWFITSYFFYLYIIYRTSITYWFIISFWNFDTT